MNAKNKNDRSYQLFIPFSLLNSSFFSFKLLAYLPF